MSVAFGVRPRMNGSKFFPKQLPPEPAMVSREWAEERAKEEFRRGYRLGLDEGERAQRVAAAIANTPEEPLQHRVTLRSIAKEVAIAHGLTLVELMSTQRTRRITWPRQEAYFRMSTETTRSTTAIANFFGFDHTTVIHGIRRHRERMIQQAEGGA